MKHDARAIIDRRGCNEQQQCIVVYYRFFIHYKRLSCCFVCDQRQPVLGVGVIALQTTDQAENDDDDVINHYYYYFVNINAEKYSLLVSKRTHTFDEDHYDEIINS